MKIFIFILRVILSLIFIGVLFFLWGFGPVTSLWLRLGLAFFAFILFYPEIRKIFKLNNNIRFAVSLIVLFVLITGWHYVVIKNFYKKIFEGYIARPIPAHVKLIEGDNGRWLDSETYFIFETDAPTFQFIANDYFEVPITADSIRIDGLSNYIKEELWRKSGIKCYRKIKEGDTRPDHKGSIRHYKREYYLLWDEAIGRAYFYRPHTTYK